MTETNEILLSHKLIIKDYLQTQLQTPQPKTKNTYWKRKIIKQLLTELQK